MTTLTKRRINVLLMTFLLLQAPVALALFTDNVGIDRIAKTLIWATCLPSYIGAVVVCLAVMSGGSEHFKDFPDRAFPIWFSLIDDVPVACACAYMGWMWTTAIFIGCCAASFFIFEMGKRLRELHEQEGGFAA